MPPSTLVLLLFHIYLLVPRVLVIVTALGNDLDPFRPWLQLGHSQRSYLPLLFLGDTSDITAAHDFITRDFGARSRFIPDSPRQDRVDWVRVRRRWLPDEDVDRILLLNTSALTNSHGNNNNNENGNNNNNDNNHLLLGDDVELVRGNQRMHSMCTHGCGSHVDIQKVHAAFQDGFSVHLKHLHRRVASVAAVAQAVRSFWHADDVDVKLIFAPPAPRKDKAKPQFMQADSTISISISNTHQFLVQLDGAQHVRVNVGGEPVAAHKLEEGDILYVPPRARSCVTQRDTKSISLHAAFSISGIPTRIEGILSSILGIQDDEINQVLPGTREATWRHLLATAASTVSALIPGMNLPLPLSPAAQNLIRDATGTTPVEALEAELMRFATAAEEGELFMPLLEELSSSIDEPELAQWAKQLLRHRKVGNASMNQITRMFRHCLRRIRSKAAVMANNGVRNMRNAALKKAEMNRAKLVAGEKDALERHEQVFNVDTPSAVDVISNKKNSTCQVTERKKESHVCDANYFLNSLSFIS